MQEIYDLLKEAEMLVIASPIYYHGVSGQLKCVLDRFYSAAYPGKPENLKKAAMFLSSGDADMYEGAMFSYQGDFPICTNLLVKNRELCHNKIQGVTSVS